MRAYTGVLLCVTLALLLYQDNHAVCLLVCSQVLPVSSVLVETDIGSFIINTVTLACISLDSAVGSASGFWPEGREFESQWNSLFYFFLRTVSVLTKTRNSVCKRAYGTTGRPTACLNSLCSLCTACGRAMLFWGISAILTGNDAFNRLIIIIFVISRSIVVEFDTSLFLFRKFYFWRPFWFFF